MYIFRDGSQTVRRSVPDLFGEVSPEVSPRKEAKLPAIVEFYVAGSLASTDI